MTTNKPQITFFDIYLCQCCHPLGMLLQIEATNICCNFYAHMLQNICYKKLKFSDKNCDKSIVVNIHMPSDFCSSSYLIFILSIKLKKFKHTFINNLLKCLNIEIMHLEVVRQKIKTCFYSGLIKLQIR